MRGQPITLNTLRDVNPAGLAAGAVPVWDSTSKTFKMGSSHAIHQFTKTGAISAASTGTDRRYNDTGMSLTIVAVRASLGTVATTTSVILDVKMNGTTLYTTTANRPTLTTGTATVLATLPDIITWTAGSYLTVDVVQGDVAAAKLSVQITAG